MNTRIMTINRPPLGAPKTNFSASYAEGFEGMIDGMIQGTFRSVDNEIDQQDFESLIKNTAKEIVDDFNGPKPAELPEIAEEKIASDSDEFNQMRELLLLPGQKRGMSGKHFSIAAPRRHAETTRVKPSSNYQK